MELNCITGLIENAEEQARKLKERCLNDVPLYGLPVSVKESMNIQVCIDSRDVHSRISNPLEPVPKLNRFQIMGLEK